MPKCIFCEKPDSTVMIPGTDLPCCPHCLSVQVVAAQALHTLLETEGDTTEPRARLREWVQDAADITNGKRGGPSLLYRRARRRCEAEDPHLCATLPCPRCASLALGIAFAPAMTGGPPPEMLRGVK
jgi:hypothetical protein